MRFAFVVVLALGACKEPKQKVAPQPEATQQTPAPEPAPAPVPVIAVMVKDAGAAQAEPEPESPKIQAVAGIATVEQYGSNADKLMGDLTAVFTKNSTQCGKLAEALVRYHADHKADYAATRAFGDANPEAKAAYEDAHATERQQHKDAVALSMQACQKDEHVRAALQQLGK